MQRTTLFSSFDNTLVAALQIISPNTLRATSPEGNDGTVLIGGTCEHNFFVLLWAEARSEGERMGGEGPRLLYQRPVNCLCYVLSRAKPALVWPVLCR